jgi:aryl-alcohol dehydrogenase-like predicted oxidoreductase
MPQRGIPLASNQVEYSLLHRRPETNEVLDACRELDVTLIAYQPLAGDALTGKYTPTNRPAVCGSSSSRSAPGVRRRLSRSLRCFGRSASVTAKPRHRWRCVG